MDAIEVLKRDHQKFRKTFAWIARRHQTLNVREKTVSKLLDDLMLHEAMEHTQWYPFLPKEQDALVRHLR